MIPSPVSKLAPENLWRFYRGKSMRNIFHSGDYLIIDSCSFEQIRLGDVIVFRSKAVGGKNHIVVHRLISMSGRGLVTRGDANRQIDEVPVTREDLLGRAVALERNGKRLPVPGGKIGLGQAFLARLGLGIIRILILLLPLGRSFWRRLRRSRFIHELWKPEITQVRFVVKSGSVVKYLCHGRVIARWWPVEKRFQCSYPYDLIIPNPDTLQ